MMPSNQIAFKGTPLPCFDRIESPIPKKSANSPFSAKIALLTKSWGCKGKAIFVSRSLISVISYIGESIATSGELITKGFAKTNQTLKNTCVVLKDTALHLKFFLIVNIPIKLGAMGSEMHNVWNSIQRKDREGIAFSTILLTLTSASLFDDITIFVNAALQVFAEQSLRWITEMASPLGLAITSVTVLTKSYHLYHLSKFNQELDRKILALETVSNLKEEISSQDLRAYLTPFLQKHLGSDLSSQKKAQAILQRHTSPEVVNLMQKIADLLNDNATLSDQQITKVLDLLKEIQTALKDEKKFQRGLIVSTVIAGLAFGLLLTPAAPVATPLLLAASVAMEIAFTIDYKKKLNQRRLAAISRGD